MYPSIAPGSLPSFSELESTDDRPDTPLSSIADEMDWTGNSLLDDITSQLESVEKHLSHFGGCLAQLPHDGSCRLLRLYAVHRFRPY